VKVQEFAVTLHRKRLLRVAAVTLMACLYLLLLGFVFWWHSDICLLIGPRVVKPDSYAWIPDINSYGPVTGETTLGVLERALGPPARSCPHRRVYVWAATYNTGGGMLRSWIYRSELVGVPVAYVRVELTATFDEQRVLQDWRTESRPLLNVNRRFFGDSRALR